MPFTQDEKIRGKILIVDDTRVDLVMLQEMLSLLGHIAYAAGDGNEALDLARAHHPDLILLDVNMPGMNGYEVCALLKQDPNLSAIPVIFLSGRTDTFGITHAFAAGGIDYVTKPYIIEELVSRIDTHLKLHFTQLELRKYTNYLEELVTERTKDLRKALERLKILDTTKNDFLDVIAHELKTPATSVLAVGQLAIRAIPDSKERQELTAIFDKGSQRLQRTIDNALLLARLQSSDSFEISERLDVAALVADVIANDENLANDGHNEIVRPENCGSLVVGNSQLAEQCVTTILNVALKMADPGARIVVECQADSEFSHIIFHTPGRTFAEGTLEALFDTFSYERISSQVEELGLSIPIAAQIATLFGGKIAMENSTDPSGIRITLSLKKI